MLWMEATRTPQSCVYEDHRSAYQIVGSWAEFNTALEIDRQKQTGLRPTLSRTNFKNKIIIFCESIKE